MSQVLSCSIRLVREPRLYPLMVFRNKPKGAVYSVQDKLDDRSEFNGQPSRLRIVRKHPRAQINFHPSSNRLIALFPVRYKDEPSELFFHDLFKSLKVELEGIRGINQAEFEFGETYLIPPWQVRKK